VVGVDMLLPPVRCEGCDRGEVRRALGRGRNL
jgi:hypothetical protein